MNRKTILVATGILVTGAGSAFAATRYVDVNIASPAAPYTNWATAAAVIEGAVDAAADGDEIVVTNGIYATGGRAVDGTMTNRVAVAKALTVRSDSGPQSTTILGRQAPGMTNGTGAVRCVHLADGSGLSGFTLTNRATLAYPGGIDEVTE